MVGLVPFVSTMTSALQPESKRAMKKAGLKLRTGKTVHARECEGNLAIAAHALPQLYVHLFRFGIAGRGGEWGWINSALC
jgi:hypothetical protein